MSTLSKRRSKPRRTTSPRCARQRCTKPADIDVFCIPHAEDEADRAFSIWVRERDRICTAPASLHPPECDGYLQAAHGVGRRNHTTRYDPRNVHALCQVHHYLVDQKGREGAKHVWLTYVLGTGEYDRLMWDSRTLTKRRASVQDAYDRYVLQVLA